ncbi:hypothetical protein BN6_61590 [Saccharothrix espanaensis DSM 44229]|uniref:Secreted protein n=1 Tax=Saccharothrix espanaensis (strain ATCC 51144 / DSM 44229 / JCM 9112 / NBRC 15066 / NRRL 15764) TaxID=1179773 RepID=K0K521_SACES|nr:hypothetical protein BN6_61590 [Saccharothrix espanaensis DSM 44229]
MVFTGTASACSCIPGEGEPQRYARAGYVFAGVVLSEKLETNKPDTPYDDQYRYTVKVAKEYKGDVPRRVDVVTATNGAMCGTRLTVNTKYLLFTHGDVASGTVSTHMCSGTRLASGGPPNTVPSPTSTTTPPTTPCATAAP